MTMRTLLSIAFFERLQLSTPICRALAVVLSVLSFLPTHAVAGGGKAPPLPVQLSAPASVKPGDSFEYLIHIPNKSSASYWGVTAQIDFPNNVSCSQIVSESRRGPGCQLLNGPVGQSKSIKCVYNDVYDWQVIDVRVRCQLLPPAICGSQISTVVNMNVMKPLPSQNTSSKATFTALCNNPTPTPTSTATTAPTVTSTPIPVPPLYHEIVGPMMARPGDPVQFAVRIPGPRANSYWGVDTITTFPDTLTCTQVVSQTGAQGCALVNNVLSCHYNDVHPAMGSIEAVVGCTVTPQCACPQNIIVPSLLKVAMPMQADSTKQAVLQVKCPLSQCSDGIDNDGDGKVDFPADPGCTGPIDPDEGNPELTITKTVQPTVLAGSEVTYSYVVKNVGSAPAVGLQFEDFNIDNTTLHPIDQIFTFLRASIPNCSIVPGRRYVRCPVGSLIPNEERSFTLTFQAPPAPANCGRLVMNQADVYLVPGIPGITAWAKAATSVMCPTPTFTATPTATATLTATATATAT